MKNINSKDYQDYVIKNGRFIGRFEEMYKHIEDPWHHGGATTLPYDMSLYLIDKYKICSKDGKILDIGCGKGAFISRVKNKCPLAKILAVDIAPTAIKKARDQYARFGIDFELMDIQKEYRNIYQRFDLIIMSDVMWYILPNFEKIVNSLKKNLKSKGYLLMKQTFYLPGMQKYGREVVSSVKDMLKLMKYDIVEMIELNRFKNPVAIILFKK